MSQLSEAVGGRIREVRKERGLSQEALADLAGLDRSYMSRIERGVVNLTIDKLYAIAKALDSQPHLLLPPTS